MLKGIEPVAQSLSQCKHACSHACSCSATINRHPYTISNGLRLGSRLAYEKDISHLKDHMQAHIHSDIFDYSHFIYYGVG